MKWEEIKKRFDGEWVLIEVEKTGAETFDILEGEVLYHDVDEDKVRRRLRELHPKKFAVRYVGDVPSDFAVML